MTSQCPWHMPTCWQEKQVEIVTWRHASRSGVHLQVTDLSRAKRLQLVHYLKCWESGSSWGVALVQAGETGNTYIWLLNLPQELNLVFVVYLMKLSVSRRYMVYGRWMERSSNNSRGRIKVLAEKNSTCHSVHHKSHTGRPMNRTGLKIRPEDDYEAGSGLS